ncbi:MAG: hypothetical protein AAB442_03135 [Patescibacteria group bacterium]
MTHRLLFKALAVLLTVSIIAPAAFLVATPRAHAIPVTVVGDGGWPAIFKTAVESTITAVKSVLIEIHGATTAVATYAEYLNTYVLQPLAFVMSVGLMKMITAGVLAFVVGKANGTGRPQFIQNLEKTLQSAGDVQALAFFAQYGKISNSPFAGSINSSLRSSYLMNTSLAGFWQKYKCTLLKDSPNINAFLAGRWVEGGAKTWLSLTTQTQNNPYTLYQASQAQLAGLVSGKQGVLTKITDWGQGFMSWCGSTQQTEQTDPGFIESEQTGQAAAGVNPGEPCTKEDGTPGVIMTPGTTISESLNKVLGGTQDKLVQMGSLAKEVNGILSDLSKIFATVNLAKEILGGVGSGGLAGFGSTGVAGAASPLDQYSRSTVFGVTTDTVYQNAAGIQNTSADAFESRVAKYEAAWSTIRGSANAASTALTELASTCSPHASTAQTALTSLVNPVLARATTAATTIATARAFIAKIRSEQNLTDETSRASFVADTQALQTMAPTNSDAANAEQDAIVTDSPPGSVSGIGAQASPPGSLNVSGGSLVDQMNLIGTNANALKAACVSTIPSCVGESCP